MHLHCGGAAGSAAVPRVSAWAGTPQPGADRQREWERLVREERFDTLRMPLECFVPKEGEGALSTDPRDTPAHRTECVQRMKLPLAGAPLTPEHRAAYPELEHEDEFRAASELV